MRSEKKTSQSSTTPLLGRSRANGSSPTAWERSREELFGDWYGEESRPAVLAALHPQARRIGQLVDRFLDTIQSPDARVLAEVEAHWGKVASCEALVQKMRPVHFARGVLTVEVADATLLYVFREPRLQERLLDAVRRFAGDAVQRLRMVMKGRGSTAL